MRILAAFAAVFGVLVAAGCGPTGDAGKPAGKSGQKVVAVALRTRSHQFYKDLEEGLAAEAAKHDYRLVVQSAEDAPTTQARQIEDFVTQKVDAIIVIPCQSDAVAPALRGAAAAKIPVFTADIAATGADVVAHVASDNYQGGKVAGTAMASMLHEKGKLIIIDQPTVSSVQDRVRGFEDEIKKHAGMEIVGKPSSDGERVKAQAVMEDALTRHADLAGVFGINDDSALGALRAVEAAGRRQIVIIGYDATPEAQAAIKRGSALRADVIQWPRKIGARTIEAIALHFAGEKVPRVTPVAVGIADAEYLSKSDPNGK
jgi:ribose transport system substrate-binding protein